MFRAIFTGITELLLKDEKIIRALERKAEENGVSPEEELRRILREALNKEETALNESLASHLLAFPGCGENEDDSWVFDRHDPRNIRPSSKRRIDLDD